MSDDTNDLNWKKASIDKYVEISWDKHGTLLGIIDRRYGMSIFIPHQALVSSGICVSNTENSLNYDVVVTCAHYSFFMKKVPRDRVSELTAYMSKCISKLLKNPIENSNIKADKADKNDKEFGNIEL